MKVKPPKDSPQKTQSRPFLILPLLDNLSLITPEEEAKMPKNTGLKLFTKTWPPKKKTNEDKDRPLTATLEKPTILDINLIGKVDMSTVRKEFLNISNLCRLPMILKTRKTNSIARPLSLPAKKKKRSETSEEDDESVSVKSARKTKLARPNNRLKQLCKANTIKIKVSDANNNEKTKTTSSTTTATATNKTNESKLKSKNGGKSTKLLPEPCTTCGRPDQPERFHSHPVNPVVTGSVKKTEEIQKIPVKSSVQKPIAMKYKSKQSTEKAKKPPPKIQATPKPVVPQSGIPRIKSAKRTLTCYICGREFGTASLPLHEPKCLEKWERENAKLPPNLQRKPPIKPEGALTQEDWNQQAWESSQATLTPCANCGRTFYPDRLVVHQRSCKTPQNGAFQRKIPDSLTSSTNSVISNSPQSSTPSPSLECYICGRTFGSNSMKIHEKNCLKKWTAENEALPPDMRSSMPVKGDRKDQKATIKEETKEETTLSRISSAKKPPLFPCYLCGKLFTVNSIYIHEPQCLKRWKTENDKLPLTKRRPQPLKPDIKFTMTGDVDYIGTFNRIWENHLVELKPCKFCGRTFFPSRVRTHEKFCSGSNKIVNK